MQLQQHKDLSVEVWGGVECSINRVNDTFFSQMDHSGHISRLDDLDMIKELGINTLRYPVLWEHIAPKGLKRADWSWADERLYKLKELGINPVVGFVHHGSGPEYTSLIDPDFGKKLAEYAFAVADRYPWLQMFTPVNEPLTTARFSGLYGLWYPHGKDDSTFVHCFVNQMQGVIEAMKAIRAVIPDAKLVQTEDMGKVFSTPKLKYQADFENERRWLTYDFLMGKFGPWHKLWDYFIQKGKVAKRLDYFMENKCEPAITGLNYYVTSERFLDENTHLYPRHMRGGNGKHRYVDIEAVRVRREGLFGLGNIVREAAKRYNNAEIAITEVHLGCTREEQIRWLKDTYQACIALKSEGINLKAMTIWSLLGAYNWNVLLTKDVGHYEPGAFDTRSEKPRITALGRFVKSLTAETPQLPDHIATPGWWKRDERLIFMKNEFATNDKKIKRFSGLKPVLITGATGTLGRAFAKICEIRNIPYKLLNRGDMNITDPASIESALEKFQPWAVINATGYVRVDEAEVEVDKCMQVNAFGAIALAEACKNVGIKVVTFSSDLVFDGASKKPYIESNPMKPLNIYGLSKKEAEEKITALCPDALIIRTSAFFGPWDEYNFVTQMMKHITKGNVFLASSDNVVSPTYVPDLVNATLDLLIDQECGIWHLANPSEITWSDFAIKAAKMAGENHKLIKPCRGEYIRQIAGRPLYSALGSERGLLLPPLENAMQRYINERILI